MTAAVEGNSGVQSRLGEQLEAIVVRRLASDQLVLPAMPAAAMKCLSLLRTSNFSLNEAAQVIETDPILAARVVRLSNSAAYAGRETIVSIGGAVTRIGLQKLRAFLVEASAARLFESNDRRIAEASKMLWNHSVAVAVVSRDLAAICGCADPEAAYLGGLLHDVGKSVIAAMLLDAERSLADVGKNARWIGGDDWIAVVQRRHRSVGVSLVERWKMPPAICNAVRDCGDYDSAERFSVSNLVKFANAVVKQRNIYVGEVVADDNDAMIMIGQSLLGIEAKQVERATAGLDAMGFAR